MADISDRVVHLTLRGRRSEPLVRDDDDWAAVSDAAERMLFWCGGHLHGSRCEGNEMRFAVEPGRAPLGSMVRHLAGGYAGHVRRRYGWEGGVFKHYLGITLDGELYLDDLVIWMHREPRTGSVWTANAAYLIPHALPWITTERVREALGGWGTAAYRRRQAEPMAAALVAELTRGKTLRASAMDGERSHPARILGLVGTASARTGISTAQIASNSHRHGVSRARALVAVLATREGIPAAEVARLFHRSRSTLIEQAEHYRKTDPHLFQ